MASREISARCLRLAAKAADAASLAPSIEIRGLAREREQDVLVEVRAAAVNPSEARRRSA
jgi:NADPH:quinone reductase-like Zn-dependent oxidoreductase